MEQYFVYLVSCSSESHIFLKLGKTNNLSRRLRELQTGCPHKLENVFIVQSEFEEEAIGLESLFKYLLKSERYRGEWYTVTPEFLSNLEDCLCWINFGEKSFDEIELLAEEVSFEAFEIILHNHSFQFFEVEDHRDLNSAVSIQPIQMLSILSNHQ